MRAPHKAISIRSPVSRRQWIPIIREYESGNIMSDGREPTLQSQAIDAVLTHRKG